MRNKHLAKGLLGTQLQRVLNNLPRVRWARFELEKQDDAANFPTSRSQSFVRIPLVKPVRESFRSRSQSEGSSAEASRRARSHPRVLRSLVTAKINGFSKDRLAQ